MTEIDRYRFIVPMTKITDYLLNPHHRKGGSKCAFLTGFGFARDAPQFLAMALLDHATPNLIESVVLRDGYTRVLFRGPLRTPDGRNPTVRTVWQPEPNGYALLITLRPR